MGPAVWQQVAFDLLQYDMVGSTFLLGTKLAGWTVAFIPFGMNKLLICGCYRFASLCKISVTRFHHPKYYNHVWALKHEIIIKSTKLPS